PGEISQAAKVIDRLGFRSRAAAGDAVGQHEGIEAALLQVDVVAAAELRLELVLAVLRLPLPAQRRARDVLVAQGEAGLAVAFHQRPGQARDVAQQAVPYVEDVEAFAGDRTGAG